MKKIILATIIATATAAFIYANTTKEKEIEAPIVLAKAEIPTPKVVEEITSVKEDTPILLSQTETPVAKVIEKIQSIKKEVPILLSQTKTQVISVTKKASKMSLAKKQEQRETTLAAELAKKEIQRIENTKKREANLKKLNDDLQVKADTRADIVY